MARANVNFTSNEQTDSFLGPGIPTLATDLTKDEHVRYASLVLRQYTFDGARVAGPLAMNLGRLVF
jgi:hypothetical protein